MQLVDVALKVLLAFLVLLLLRLKLFDSCLSAVNSLRAGVRSLAVGVTKRLKFLEILLLLALEFLDAVFAGLNILIGLLLLFLQSIVERVLIKRLAERHIGPQG